MLNSVAQTLSPSPATVQAKRTVEKKKDTPSRDLLVFFRIFLSGLVRKWAMFSKLAATTFEEPTMTHTAVFAPGFAGHIILRMEMGRPSLSGVGASCLE